MLRFLMNTLLLLPVLAVSAATPSERLHSLLRKHWEFTLRTQPELATEVEDSRYNDRLSDPSPAATAQGRAMRRRLLADLRGLPGKALTEEERLDRDLLAFYLAQELDAARFHPWEWPLNQMRGLHVDFAGLASAHPFRIEKDFEDWARRLEAFGPAVDATILQMRRGLARGLRMPAFMVEEILEQVRAFEEPEKARTVFLACLATLPSSIPQREHASVRGRLNKALEAHTIPAYKRLHRFLETELRPRPAHGDGLWAQPSGRLWYRQRIREMTTTHLSPSALHTLGLREVSRIEAEMVDLARSQGFVDLAECRKALAEDPRQHPASREDLLSRYQGFLKVVAPELSKLFGRLPKAGVEVVPLESFREAGGPRAQYRPGSPDGQRPGRVIVNTGSAEKRSLIEVEAVAYHEGFPGHLFQSSLVLENAALPAFRRWFTLPVFEEGWALYAEGLPKELGFYSDPTSNFGRLDNERFRAARLVVDTGLHAQKWHREWAVAYLAAHSSLGEAQARAEVNRYVALPGQALAYTVGLLKIRELRKRAEMRLGQGFNLRHFHDALLESGALPLHLLERWMNVWIDLEKESVLSDKALLTAKRLQEPPMVTPLKGQLQEAGGHLTKTARSGVLSLLDISERPESTLREGRIQEFEGAVMDSSGRGLALENELEVP